MKTLRTPDARFENLPDFPYTPNYVEVDGLRMHYVDEGRGDVVLLLHGEPSWSYLYRHMIPPLSDAGLRVVAPDLIGFGRSDKPARKSDYSYAGHVAWMRQFIGALDLRDITLFCQDWGSLIGLRVAAENERRFARIAVGNGGMPTGDQPMPKAFEVWRAFARWSPWFPIGRIVQSGTVTNLPADVVAAYDEYTDRGESENRNKELKRGLQADRLSDHRYFANLFRLHLHAAAYNLLVHMRRRIANPPPESEDAEIPSEALAGGQRRQRHNLRRRYDPLGEGQPDTWRTRLIKVAVCVYETTRRVVVQLVSTRRKGPQD